ncbi:DUF4160 domain-containing protein [Spirosoma montaniterrae]|uniref:DUF4160 domain-containing protein n=1 Tax=Spirosoma montaniterrae TaxID=1178516 RepID=UPI00097DB206|nr:DUF4160 domain-containing protein [Spirosoma montaniterrae]
MPEISRFYGIVITMYFSDHNPPHFHARYGDDKAEYDIQTLALLAGKLPKRTHFLVIEWAIEYREELLRN